MKYKGTICSQNYGIYLEEIYNINATILLVMCLQFTHNVFGITIPWDVQIYCKYSSTNGNGMRVKIDPPLPAVGS